MAQVAQATDWIEWAGGECPVPEGTPVDVQHKDGDKSFGSRAGDLFLEGEHGFDWWKHQDREGPDGFVIAYRVVAA